jgi:hypothetical protein
MPYRTVNYRFRLFSTKVRLLFRVRRISTLAPVLKLLCRKVDVSEMKTSEVKLHEFLYVNL